MLSLSFARPNVCEMGSCRECPGVCRGFYAPVNYVALRRPVVMRDILEEIAHSVDDTFDGILSHVCEKTAKRDDALEPTKYEMKFAMQDFKPEEIKVKVQGQSLVVEAKHENKEEKDGLFSHSFREIRKSCSLPENVDKKNLSSALSSEGVLEIEAPFLPAIEEKEPIEKKEIEVTYIEEDSAEKTSVNGTE